MVMVMVTSLQLVFFHSCVVNRSLSRYANPVIWINVLPHDLQPESIFSCIQWVCESLWQKSKPTTQSPSPARYLAINRFLLWYFWCMKWIMFVWWSVLVNIIKPNCRTMLLTQIRGWDLRTGRWILSDSILLDFYQYIPYHKKSSTRYAGIMRG